ncbi:hypothetical protein AG1IA_03736 [Rhizoctonia solani AG-1 IA]|uniref:Uncharacterized protein n=1 Tax=Thanatephorus cucumeris (strain AG1-IA) TaxID=983506 RepID=L8WZM8_THACA|nr:hypothetical protein AG1IA_03736 [Rhizoctonia solani AG-1 IA]
MPLTDALPYLPELPVGSNSTNGTFPVPGIGDIPAPFDILAACILHGKISLRGNVAWQLRENENLGLNIIASLNNRSESILEIEREEGETTSQTMAQHSGVSAYDEIVYRIRVINNEPFLRRWIFSVPISNELRELSAKAEKLYQLYLEWCRGAAKEDGQGFRGTRVENKLGYRA